MRLSEKELIDLATSYIEIDPNLASTIFCLTNCRVADEILKSSTEEWMMSLCVAISNHALYAVQYGTWLVTGGTDNETNS